MDYPKDRTNKQCGIIRRPRCPVLVAIALTGDRDAAVRALLAGKVDPAAIGPPDDPVLTTSEGQFAGLSRQKKRDLQERAIATVSDLKDLARYCIQRGNEALQQQDREAARKYFEAAHRLGEAVEEGDRLLLIEQTGIAIKAMAQKELQKLSPD